MSSSTVPLHTDSWGYRTGTWGGCSPGATTCSTAWGQMPHPVIESPECNCTCISCMTNQRAVSSDHGQRILRINVPRSEVVHLCEGLYRTRRLCSIHRHASYTVRAEGNPPDICQIQVKCIVWSLLSEQLVRKSGCLKYHKTPGLQVSSIRIQVVPLGSDTIKIQDSKS